MLLSCKIYTWRLNIGKMRKINMIHRWAASQKLSKLQRVPENMKSRTREFQQIRAEMLIMNILLFYYIVF